MAAEDAIALMERFVAPWPAGDVAALGTFFAEDAVYHNIPLRPIHGRPAIEQAFRGFLLAGSTAAWELRHIAAAGDVVLTERIDRFVIEGRRVELPVMGTFEVRDGRIVAWRDYFDLTMAGLSPDA